MKKFIKSNKKFRFQVLKFKRSNQATSWNQKPLVKVGDQIKKGEPGSGSVDKPDYIEKIEIK